ncbi:M3 family oligoendopeptidase [Sedimentibacter sp. zth1]|uniref:M3 family oligoendopeptidase n=1 Tax=Sedimentibacter sp. zth1 TaxID=2816908 RepID=UPI001A90ED6E|nr:M3 family oligoendopeptidase [Sedimentibacter sp. zth1]QSX04832.1 M3 family oligoendopeptidase [Sedimentibacter sp. zth1]
MNKFNQINYIRPNIKELKIDFNYLIKDLKKAKSYDRFKQIYLDSQESVLDFITSYMLSSIRNNIDTTDKFYEDEMKFFNNTLPKTMMLLKKLNKVLINSEYREKLEEDFGSQMFRITEASLSTMKNRVIVNLIKENNLCTEYSKEAAACKTTFEGEECNFYGLLKHMESIDRQERKEAYCAWAGLYQKVSPRLDEIYDKLVRNRSKMAKKLGFKDYTTLAYLQRNRFDYKPEDIKKFRDNIKKYVVPVCEKLIEQQKDRLGIDEIKYYDEKILFTDGNAIPIGDREELVTKAQKMYRELSSETKEFFDFMVNYELFDLETKPNKHLGGYCTALPKYKAPFIFSNFNGTSADIDVLTHEAGHAFEAFTAMRTQKIFNNCYSTSEINEIHSMAMEFFTYPWMKEFFGESVDKYYYSHLVDSIMVIPYIACVDEFQHKIYEIPNMSALKRREIWRELEKEYMPWRDYDGNEFLENGGFWMQKQHIFLYPFYYIDYALAQICVYELYGRMKEDKEKAWNDYYELCKAGGSKGYFELLKLANLKNPFEEETMKEAIKVVTNELNLEEESIKL